MAEGGDVLSTGQSRGASVGGARGWSIGCDKGVKVGARLAREVGSIEGYVETALHSGGVLSKSEAALAGKLLKLCGAITTLHTDDDTLLARVNTVKRLARQLRVPLPCCEQPLEDQMAKMNF